MNYNFKKKPTIKEIAGVTLELSNRVNSLFDYMSELEKAFSLYVEMKGDIEDFKKHIDKRFKELEEKKKNDTKTNGDTDGDNLQGNTEDENSGTERVREKSE